MENFERKLENIAFPNYEKFSDIVNKITQVINNLALYKTIRVKNQSNEWFDGVLNKYLIGTSYLKSSRKANFTSTS